MIYRISETLIILVLSILLLSNCSNTIDTPTNGYLSVEGERFTDSLGRTITLNGLNHVTKIPDDCYLYKDDEALFRQFKKWGFNCIRYGIYWDGLEPEPGKINEIYLKEIDKRVKWAEENGLWLILDMHQDLYSRKFDNGAPIWATFDENLPHEKGNIWSDAYLVSLALHKAFDNFWNNVPAPDGIGIQDHYISVWRILAKRYANSPSVAGFDIMNEPFMGTDGQKILPKLLEGYAINLAKTTGQQPTKQELVKIWRNETKRIKALNKVDNKEDYAFIVDNVYEEVQAFEQGTLSCFYQKVRDAIRSVNEKQIIFLEHSYFCNLGVRSSFHIPKDKNGQPDKLCAYAPHGYDLVTDTDAATDPCYKRMELIFERIFEAGKKKKVPVIVGEWGAFYIGEEYLEPASYLIQLFEKASVGQTYWCYWNGIEKQDYFFETLSRYYPMSINGKLLNYENNQSEKKFSCSWEENTNDASSFIYIPNLGKIKENIDSIELIPESETSLIHIEDSESGYLEIKPLGGNRNIIIQL